MSQDWNIGQKSNSLKKKDEKAVLVGLALPGQSKETIAEHLDELEFLALTAGAKTVKTYVQQLDHPDSRTFIGSGKVDEIATYIEDYDVDLVIFDDDLSAKQTSILEEVFKRKIIDRSSLILDIFAARARTAQARTQVDLAQMQYLLPRLRGLWTHLERQRGGIGMRGPGE
ncbi:MAG: GTPase HflX, partial [Bacteroidota bacterium]